MQADIPPTLKRSNIDEQATQVATCPLCQTPLITRGTPSIPQQTFVMCPSCGYSAPAIQRQHRPGQSTTTSSRRQTTGSSVWIDPTVSAYLGSDERREYSPSLVPPTPPAQKRPVPNTTHPIPHRASAQQSHPQPVRVRPKYSRLYPPSEQQENDVTRIPTFPPPSMWQYESSQFEAESSLPALSLVVNADAVPSEPTHLPVVQPVQPPSQQTISAKSLLELPLPGNDAAELSPAPTAPEQKKQHITDIDEIDTLPSALVQFSPSTMPRQLSPALSRVSSIDEVDTLPPGSARTGERSQYIVDIDKADTLPPMVVPGAARTIAPVIALANSTSLVPVQPASMQVHIPSANVVAASAPTEQVVSLSDPSSWTAGGVRESAYARRIAERSHERKHIPQMKPIDHVRWWLLHPGRLEGLLWLGGTLLLLIVTFSLLIVTAVSLSWIAPNSQEGSSSSNTTTAITPTGAPTMITTHGLTLILENAGPVVPGQSVKLQGKGFSPLGHITFTGESEQPLLVQGSQVNAVQADEHGTFTVALLTSGWQPGIHHIVVRDVVSGRTVSIPLLLTNDPSGKSTTPTASASKTATPSAPVGGTIPTAVGSTPPPFQTPTTTPTLPSPTPTQAKPSPTPTLGITPTNTPGTTPTVGTTPTPSPGASGQGDNILTTAGVASLPTARILSPWVWLLIGGYCLSMLMLGLAGMLFKRR